MKRRLLIRGIAMMTAACSLTFAGGSPAYRLPASAAVRATAADDVDQALEKFAAYEYGKDNSSAAVLAEALIKARKNPAARLGLEKKFDAFLKTGATLQSKEFICKQLSIIGTNQSIPQLVSMLADPSTADMAHYALERIAGPQSEAALLKALSSAAGKEKIGIITTLGARKDPIAVPALSKLINDSDQEVVKATATALARIASPAAAKALGLARTKAAEPLRINLVDAYLQCAANMAARGEKVAALAIYKQVNVPRESKMFRIAAVQGLAKVGGPAALPALTAAVKSDDPMIQASAIRILGSMKGVGAGRILLAQLPSLQGQAQVQAITALTVRGDAAALPLLKKSVASTDSDVRIAALDGVGVIGDPSCVVILAEAAAAARGAEQTAARTSLYQLKAAGTDKAVIDAIDKTEQKVKVELIRAVAERSIAPAAAVLIRTAQNSKGEIRRESLKSLRDIATPDQVPVLTDLLLSSSDSDRPEATRTLAVVLRKGGKPSVAHLLKLYGSETDVEKRGALLEVLGQAGNEDALPVLKDGLKDSNVELKRAAILAISEWPKSEPMADLLNIARNDPDESMQVLAFRGYIKLMSLPENRTPQESVKLLADTYKMARRAEEKKAVLGALPLFPCREAFELANSATKDESVAEEAKLAIQKLREAFRR